MTDFQPKFAVGYGRLRRGLVKSGQICQGPVRYSFKNNLLSHRKLSIIKDEL